MKPSKSSWAHISGLRLADPLFMKPGSIDLILGAEIYGSIILAETIKGPPLTPTAQSTIFGLILSGPVAQDSPVSIAKIHHCSLDFHLDKQLEQFWIQESITENQGSELSLEEEDCEQQYVSTVSRNETGRYIVRLPLKGSPKKLGNTRSSAIKMIQSLQHKLNSNPEYRHLYSEFLREYEALIHMSKASPTLVEGKPIFYLPHHGVFREVSSTTKLRVVFNGSYRSSTGVSLNDILHTGAKLQTNISDVLLWFRQYRYVFAADIEKMFRQILIHQEDWDLQRIWWFSDNNLQEFHLRTVTYGLACAPFLALRTINQLIIDHGHQFPLAIGPLTKGRYVDDIFGGADSLSECLRIIKEVDSLCNAGCFPLQKWISNVSSVLSNILHERHAKEPTIIIDESSAVRTLGLLWKPSSDQFQFSVTSNTVQQVTKRNVLSRISQVFDPLGFISPVIIQAKIFMQQLWLIKSNWDDPLPTQLENQWRAIEIQFQELSNVSIPRFLGIIKSSSIQLHGFSDASQFAMSAVIYIRVETANCTDVNFVCAKTKVAPLKKMTIPRLELTAATLLVKLAQYVQKILVIENVQICLWIDSSVALTWITSHCSKWKEFVRNRVSFIQENLPSARWRSISGKENPADCA